MATILQQKFIVNSEYNEKQALKAARTGTPYGVKRLEPLHVIEDHNKLERTGYEITCPKCGKTVVMKSHQVKFCSEKCRKSIANKKYRDKKKPSP